MKEKLKNKKVVYTIITIISLLLVLAGITYAYWVITRAQSGENAITSGCLDIALSDDSDAITLTEQFPISDEEGMALTPYTFTVTNNCNSEIDYQVALESIGDESTALKTSSIKVALDNSISLLSNKTAVDTTVSNAYAANKLGVGTLAAKGSDGDSVTHTLRIWIDYDAPNSEQNKTYSSKISVTVGQGIFNPFKEGTLAYDILSNYGGANAVSEIDATEYDHTVTASSDTYVSTSSNYYYGTSYAYDAETGYYTLSGNLVQATTAECRAGTKTCGKYTLKNTSSTYSNTKIYEVTDFQTSGNYVTVNTINYVNAFGIAVTTESSLNKAQDDLGDSYYFRGASTDNYVQFGSYAAGSTVNGTTYDVETPIYWRIVRINGDGTIRLIYDGTELVANGTTRTATIANSAYNPNHDDAKYVGYTYDVDGTETDSTIKDVVDAWYDANLKTTYSEYIADGIFCNDREVASTSSTTTLYAPYDRLRTNKSPVLTCTNKSDRYTISTELGNGKLTDTEGNARPIGLLTADEAFFAGGTTAANKSYYLYSGERYWTSTPFNFSSSSNSGAFAWGLSGSGTLDFLGLVSGADNSSNGVRPVINLKADVKYTGNGMIDNPYQIVTE